MTESLESILCGDVWHYDTNRRCKIKFDANSISFLVCRSDEDVFIAAEFDWELISPPSAAQSSSSSTTFLTAISLDSDRKLSTTATKSRHLIKLSLQITLTKRRRDAGWNTWYLNEERLYDSAFAPKTYTVHLERGDDFIAPGRVRFYAKHGWRMPDWTPLHAFRITFAPSPYPPPEEWRDPMFGPCACRPYEFDEFCSRECGRVRDHLWVNDYWRGIIRKILWLALGVLVFCIGCGWTIPADDLD